MAAGFAIALCAVGLTGWITPLRDFPLLLAFPVIILVCWYLGMFAGALCAVTEAALIDAFLTNTQFHLSVRSMREEARLAMFLAVSLLLGWALRRMGQQRAQLAMAELQRQLSVANAQREFAEERSRANEVLREREDLLQIALKANGMGLWIWDLRANTTHWSDEVYRIAYLEPGAMEAGTESWLAMVHPEDAPRIRAAVERTRKSGIEYHQQYRIRLRDGSERWVESQGRCQRDSEGQPLRVVGVISDVTSRKCAEEAMLRTEKLAVAGRLAASVAHEINNPLEAVVNLLYLIGHARTTESAAELAQQALTELMRVSLITQQTLKFHRQVGTPRPALLSEIVQTVFALFRGRMRSSQIAPELRVSHESEISCMPGEVQQIFANLISNAIDAMPQGGRLVVRLRPSCDWRDHAVAGMRATFFDTGCGMDPLARQRLFEPFFTTKADTGTGLGMWVVAQLVERHGGSVHVWSTQRSAGTAVSVFLPTTTAAEMLLSAGASAVQHP